MATTDKSGWSEEVKAWDTELTSAQKRWKDFRKDGKKVVELYESMKKANFEYNILYSNTETILPALYNATPRPVVKRRYNDEDPVGKAASTTIKRLLEFFVDSNLGVGEYPTFDALVEQAVLEALTPGIGLTKFKYDPKYGAEIPREEGAQGEPLHEVTAESVCGEYVPWDRVLTGFAKTWDNIPWLTIEHFFTEAEIKDQFPGFESKVPYSSYSGKDEDDGNSYKDKSEEKGGEDLCHVYEIWDKATKQVIFIAEGYGEVLKKVDDPLELTGFFPCPKPLTLYPRMSSMIPKSLYATYEEQAKELNTCTVRINKIMRAVKVRGFYDSTLTGLKELMTKEDNSLMPAENVSAMLQGQTLDKAIWFFPVEKLVAVLQQLYAQREQCKNVIYEITGISDILRGSSAASETATAQNIKNQWGTLRLKRWQKIVMLYVRDSLRIVAEIACTKFSQETIAAMTGLQFPTAQQKQMAQMQAQQVIQQAVSAGQQPPPPPPAFTQLMNTPTWEDIIKVLQDDVIRNYKIDIETNSTIDAEASEDKQDVAEFMNAMAQLMNGLMPMVEQGFMSFDVAKAMILAIVKRFRFGVEVEDQINHMQAPQKTPGQDPKTQAEAAKLQMEQQKLKAEMDMQAQRDQHEQQQMAVEAQNSQRQAAMEEQRMQQEAALKQEEMVLRRQEMLAEHELKLMELQLKKQELAARQTALKQQPKGNKNANL